METEQNKASVDMLEVVEGIERLKESFFNLNSLVNKGRCWVGEDGHHSFMPHHHHLPFTLPATHLNIRGSCLKSSDEPSKNLGPVKFWYIFIYFDVFLYIFFKKINF